jgi:Kef-type K+ transport system membrane component KefB
MENLVLELAIIFSGAAIVSTLFLYLKQPMILAYIALGMLVGPWGMKFIENPEHIEHISHVGIILLMFLLGLHLQPQKFLQMLKTTAPITLISCFLFTGLMAGITYFMGFPFNESLIAGLSLMFSSTVVGLKLIPTTTLHQKKMGDYMISVLLFQDILAIALIIFLYSNPNVSFAKESGLLLLKTAGLCVGSFVTVKYVVIKLMRKFDIITEYLFVLAIGWCLLNAEVASLLGLSYEIGAFLGGITIGTSPIALYVAEELKPLREFFLILFFVSIGAQFDLFVSGKLLLPGLILALTILVVKPVVFAISFKKIGKVNGISKELGVRLGQASEFSLLAVYVAVQTGKITQQLSYLVQITTILTFVFSTYWVVWRYPTPIASKKELRQD